jgi:photosystem I subunit 9
MKDFITYLSTAPVLIIVTASFFAALLIEINRFFPDPLIFSF